MQDERIVDLYWQREESAIRETEKKYGKYLLKVAYNILADQGDSEESVNNTYLAAWNSMPPQKPCTLSTYLGKIARRISIDVFRKRNRAKRKVSEYAVSLSELGDCVSGGTTPEEAVEAELLAEKLNVFLHSLSEDARNTFIGRYYFLDSLREVADYCGMSESKVKSMLYRTRQSLKAYLQKEGFDL